jgi:hypothetical protein
MMMTLLIPLCCKRNDLVRAKEQLLGLGNGSIAEKAYQSSLKFYKDNFSNSQFYGAPLDQATSIGEITALVNDALEKYTGKSRYPRLRKWIQRASEKIHYYGNVLDVFVQHHPEYVALAWGLMKMVFLVSTLEFLPES